MRILIAGAGATGGSFGARLIEAGRDVTFLVRPRRAEVLARDGLTLDAPDGRRTLQANIVTAIEPGDHYDLLIVAVKAPALAEVIHDAAPAVGQETMILPLLNGMDHLDALQAAYPGQVLGGLVKIVATLDEAGGVLQMTPLSTMTVGTLDGSTLKAEIPSALNVPGIELTVVNDVLTRLWEKWAFIASAGVITCLFRGNIGDILAAGGEEHILRAIAETEEVARSAGHAVSTASHAQSVGLLTEPGSSFTSSLYRDLQHGDPVEAEHILGGLAARARKLHVATPLLDATLLQMRTHHRALERSTQTPEASA
ncbi:ketopantoate reductase family protein [Arthrobacter sp. CAU 1506]|uniref:ketopantoate reductase family protein n=1 Tax=Arthrobacter sp. CAU 1506 TaxID=2560052 RepID=UPI0010AC7C60|nr:ketopantoate reductase family protein [Arthrobacter sp. CAU 1506]TJY64155.1 ketopantoate reductase family protein [Arthrobacter sp. CAU 1506]